MTSEALRLLRHCYAFDGTPKFDDLGVFHVPFESMADGPAVETRVRDGVLRGERVALIAASGCGKSSVISHVLGPTAEGLYAVRVPVHSLMQEAANPGRVADAVVSQLASDVEQALGRTSDTGYAGGSRREVTRSRGRTRKLGLGVPASPLGAEVAEEIGRQITTTHEIELPEKIEVIFQGLQPLHEDALMPVFIFDDSDRWSAPEEEEIVEGFFTEAIRWMTDLPAAVVVAMHTHYLRPGRGGESLLQFLDTRVKLPRLPSADQLGRILMERICVHLGNADAPSVPESLSEVVTNSAVKALFGQYAEGASLRRVLQIAHIALGEAADTDAEVISRHHITAAIQA